MANAFEELLEAISDTSDREALANLGSKYKELKDGVLRQSDYSRKMNEYSAEKKKFDERKSEIDAELAKLNEWRSWRTDNWDDGLGMTKAEIAKQERIEELNAELEVLKSAQGTDMTFEEVESYIEKHMGKKQVLTREQWDKELKGSLVDRKFYEEDVARRTTGMANGLEYLYESTYPLGFSHIKEFDEPLDVAELMKFANENKIAKIPEAYKMWVAPKREELREKRHKEELTKVAEDSAKAEREKLAKERSMGQNGRIPVDQGPPIMGHVEARMKGVKEGEGDEMPENVELNGSGRVASFVVQQYYKDKAAGKTV